MYARKGKLDPAETGKTAAPALEETADDEIVAVATGKLVGPEDIVDEMFKTEAMGQTIAIEPAEGTIVAPANGVLEMVFETGHAFGMRMKDGTGLLVHIGVDTVALKGKGFTTLKKTGDTVKAGEPIVKADLGVIKAAGYSAQTMIVVTEPLDGAEPVKYLDFGTEVKAGQRIN